MREAVTVLRGRYRGRQGWISGTLQDRAAHGVTKALVHIEGAEPELLATSSLLPANAKRPAASPVTNAKAFARKARGGSDDQLILIT